MFGEREGVSTPKCIYMFHFSFFIFCFPFFISRFSFFVFHFSFFIFRFSFFVFCFLFFIFRFSFSVFHFPFFIFRFSLSVFHFWFFIFRFSFFIYTSWVWHSSVQPSIICLFELVDCLKAKDSNANACANNSLPVVQWKQPTARPTLMPIYLFSS